MSVKLSSVKADIAAEMEGETLPSTIYPGVKYTLRSYFLPDFETARDLELQKLAKIHGDKLVPRETMTSLFGELYAAHLLVSWSGFDVGYSPEVALKTLTDPAFREMVADVEVCARKVGKRQVEFVKDTVGN